MKISFREYDNGHKHEISLDNDIIGHVEKSFLSQKWKAAPYFATEITFFSNLDQTWDSFYLAGKALVKMYEDEIKYKEEMSYREDDAQPIDMNNVWGNYRLKP